MKIYLTHVRRFFCIVVIFAVLVTPSTSIATATESSPVGLWKTIDDETGQAKSHIRIWEYKGVLYGRIVKLTDSDNDNPVCEKCTGKRRNQPVLGMKIMWGLEKSDSGWWQGGSILDPKNGKIYRCKIRIKKGSKHLEVRGFIGVSLLGRSQTWQRIL